MKLQSWKNRPYPATTAARNRIGAIRPCRRQPSAVRDLSSLLLPDEALVMFFPKLLDAPGRSARQQKCADGNQQKQRDTDNQARLLHRNGFSSGCAFFSLRFHHPGNARMIHTIALHTSELRAEPYSIRNPAASRESIQLLPDLGRRT